MHLHRTWCLGWVLGALTVLSSRLQAAGPGAWRNLGDVKGLWVGVWAGGAELGLEGGILESSCEAWAGGSAQVAWPGAAMRGLGQLRPSRNTAFV